MNFGKKKNRQEGGWNLFKEETPRSIFFFFLISVKIKTVVSIWIMIVEWAGRILTREGVCN